MPRFQGREPSRNLDGTLRAAKHCIALLASFPNTEPRKDAEKKADFSSFFRM